eukprot:TRINITY_DN20074_c0_g1_i1.p1 TRINITY_DN20074_c0_g1~~TRINITY_DN20074_c0_g1_i1.p1  ORF type:complete len:476 (+),score=70.71 TRINITY_DN20074_c0_g1_i1:208-1635(+)
MADQITSEAERVEIFEEGVEQKSQIVPSSSHDGGDRRAPEEAHATIQMETLDPSWVIKINERHLVESTRSEVLWTSISCSIHRVPHMLRIQNEKAYDPTVISIGPFHYKKREGQLKFMEEQKRRYLNDILSRNGNGQSKLEQCFVAIKGLEERARRCYSEVSELDSYSFVEMMILDGCFIIEFFLKDFVDDYEDDPIFELGWLNEAVRFDLILLENQIPFFILQRLFDLTNASSPSSSLIEWPLCSYDQWDSITEERIKNSGIEIQHLLHLLHTRFSVFTEDNQSEQGSVIIPSASKLEEGGIRFRKRDKYTTSLDINFQNGVIEIPPTEFMDQTNSEILNYIAFEQCYCHSKKHFTTYNTFMDCLINNSKDVEILCREGIIVNWLGSDEELAAAYNKMGTEVTVFDDDDFYLAGVCEDINRYRERAWPKLRASLVHDYFKNPWAIISCIAALVLLLVTMTQTFFSSFPKFAYGN